MSHVWSWKWVRQITTTPIKEWIFSRRVLEWDKSGYKWDSLPLRHDTGGWAQALCISLSHNFLTQFCLHSCPNFFLWDVNIENADSENGGTKLVILRMWPLITYLHSTDTTDLLLYYVISHNFYLPKVTAGNGWARWSSEVTVLNSWLMVVKGSGQLIDAFVGLK